MKAMFNDYFELKLKFNNQNHFDKIHTPAMFFFAPFGFWQYSRWQGRHSLKAASLSHIAIYPYLRLYLTLTSDPKVASLFSLIHIVHQIEFVLYFC